MLAFDEFLERSFDKLAVYSRLLAGNRFDSDDLLADSLLVAQQRWADIGMMEYPAAYVRTIITSKHVRSKQSWFGRNVTPAAPQALPERSVPDRTGFLDERSVLAQQLATLPRRQRTAVVLRYYFDLTYEDIGDELGISAGGARTLAFRGISSIRLSGFNRTTMMEETR